MLDCQLSHSLRPGKSCLEAAFSAIEIVLRFVKHFVRFEYAKNTILPCQDFFGKEEFGELVDGDVRRPPLLLEKL